MINYDAYELARMDERLKHEYFHYERIHGKKPPHGWHDFHQAKLNRFIMWCSIEANYLGVHPNDLFLNFKAQDRPPIAKARQWDNEFSQPMRGPS